MLTKKELFLKRIFDLLGSFFLLIFMLVPIVLLAMIAAIVYKDSGFYKQERIGFLGRKFLIYKIRTKKGDQFKNINDDTNGYGRFLRKTKLNELPQLFNVFGGTMSFVGPRPDISGFADKLIDDDRIVLNILPGITGPASLKYRKEEEILAKQENPEVYNKEVIWPDKVAINKKYIENWSFRKDLIYIIKTVF